MEHNKSKILVNISGLLDNGRNYLSSSIYNPEKELFPLLSRMYGSEIKKSKIIGKRPERHHNLKSRKGYIKYKMQDLPKYLNENLNKGMKKEDWVNLKGSFATSSNFYLDILDYFGL